MWPNRTREDLARRPTGKYKVPSGEPISLVKSFFEPYSNSIFVHKYENEFQQEFFLVCCDGTFQLPRPDVQYLNGVLLSEYHLPTKMYWDLMKDCDVSYRKLCSAITKEFTFVPSKVLNGQIIGLPKYSYREAITRKLQASTKTRYSVTVTKERYTEYIKNLCVRFHIIPLIESCENLENGFIEIRLRVDNPVDIFTCIDSEIKLVVAF